MTDTCPWCGDAGTFGYGDKETGVMRWYCAEHRLAQHYADARRGEGPS